MINSFNFSLQECECGVVASFANPSGTLPKRDQYILYFDLESSLPNDIPSNININPDSYIISGTNDFIPKAIVKIQSVHRGETQSLLKLTIKDSLNKSLYTNYAKIICSPTSTVVLAGNLQSPPDNLGVNGGSLLNVSSTEELDTGMSVTASNITQPTYVTSIVNGTQLELSRNLNSSTVQKLNYTFTRVTSCVDPETLKLRENQTQNIVLDKNNNWTYLSSDKLIIQFIREDMNDDTISVIVPAKNKNILPDNTVKSDIPVVGMIYTAGRVNNDQYCIT
jgi:hypothetical protein